jgi:hypothetical protein
MTIPINIATEPPNASIQSPLAKTIEALAAAATPTMPNA